MVVPAASYKTIRIKGGGRVALRNTSGLPDKEVAQMVRFALADLDIGECAVHTKNDGPRLKALGRAYSYIPDMNGSSSKIPVWCQTLIVARWCGCEANFVDTLAHEGRHIEDYRSPQLDKILRERRFEARAQAWGGRRRREWKSRRP